MQNRVQDIRLSGSMYTKVCQNCMQGPQLCAEPPHFCKSNLATSRMAFLDNIIYIFYKLSLQIQTMEGARRAICSTKLQFLQYLEYIILIKSKSSGVWPTRGCRIWCETVLLYLLINFFYSRSLCLGSRRVFNRFVLEALAPYDTPQSYLSCLTLIYGCVHTVSHQILHPRVGHAPRLFDLIKIMCSKYCKN